MGENETKVQGVVDFVFLIDATGSMRDCIQDIKNNLGVFLDELVNNPQSPVKDWRGKVFGFRDAVVDKNAFVDNAFVSDAESLKAQLASLEATGGGDEPESLLDALYKLANMGQSDKAAQTPDGGRWRYRSTAARVVIIFTDATFHSEMAIPEAKGGTLDDVATALQGNRIFLSVFAPDRPCFDKLAEIDKVELNVVCGPEEDPQAGLKKYTGDKANFQKTMKMLAKSVSKSAVVERL